MTYARHESPSSSVGERPTGVRKVMGSIPVGDSDFFVPRSRHVDYSIFSYFFFELKIHHLSSFITSKIFPKGKTVFFVVVCVCVYACVFVYVSVCVFLVTRIAMCLRGRFDTRV